MEFDKWRKKCKNKGITNKKGGVKMVAQQIKTNPVINDGRKTLESQYVGAYKMQVEHNHNHHFYNTILNLPVESMDSVKEEADKCIARILSKRKN